MSINIHKEPAIISNTIQQNTINATCVCCLQLDFVSITHMTIIIYSLDRNSTQREARGKRDEEEMRQLFHVKMQTFTPTHYA